MEHGFRGQGDTGGYPCPFVERNCSWPDMHVELLICGSNHNFFSDEWQSFEGIPSSMTFEYRYLMPAVNGWR
jgi:hypothetical protein